MCRPQDTCLLPLPGCSGRLWSSGQSWRENADGRSPAGAASWKDAVTGVAVILPELPLLPGPAVSPGREEPNPVHSAAQCLEEQRAAEVPPEEGGLREETTCLSLTGDSRSRVSDPGLLDSSISSLSSLEDLGETAGRAEGWPPKEWNPSCWDVQS